MKREYVLYRIVHATQHPNKLYVCTRTNRQTGQRITGTPAIHMARKYTFEEAMERLAEFSKKQRQVWHLQKLTAMNRATLT